MPINPPVFPSASSFTLGRILQETFPQPQAGGVAGEPVIPPGTVNDYWQGDKTWQLKSAFPISALVAAALALKANLSGPTNFTGTTTAQDFRAQQFRSVIDPTTRFYESGAGQIMVDAAGVNIGAWNSSGYTGLLGSGCVATTQGAGSNTTQIATTAFVQAAINLVINGAPGALDTLLELAGALGSDPNFATTMVNALALKAPLLNPNLTVPRLMHAAGTGAGMWYQGQDLADKSFVGMSGSTPNTRMRMYSAALATDMVMYNLTTGIVDFLFGATTIAPAAGNNSSAVPTTAWIQTEILAKANLASPAFTGVPTAPTAVVGTNTTQLATTAFVQAAAAVILARWETMMDSSGSHTAARVAGTYWLPQDGPAGITGTGTLYPPNIFRIDSADFPTVSGITPKFRIKGVLNANDVAPTGNYTFGLYPVTRPATSGAAGLDIYTMGTVIAGSTIAVNTPAADSQNTFTSADFTLPGDGFYVIGFVSTANVAASSHLHMNVKFQRRNA